MGQTVDDKSRPVRMRSRIPRVPCARRPMLARDGSRHTGGSGGLSFGDEESVARVKSRQRRVMLDLARVQQCIASVEQQLAQLRDVEWPAVLVECDDTAERSASLQRDVTRLDEEIAAVVAEETQVRTLAEQRVEQCQWQHSVEVQELANSLEAAFLQERVDQEQELQRRVAEWDTVDPPRDLQHLRELHETLRGEHNELASANVSQCRLFESESLAPQWTALQEGKTQELNELIKEKQQKNLAEAAMLRDCTAAVQQDISRYETSCEELALETAQLQERIAAMNQCKKVAMGESHLQETRLQRAEDRVRALEERLATESHPELQRARDKVDAAHRTNAQLSRAATPSGNASPPTTTTPTDDAQP
ncbi:Cik1p KNAG_0I02380 [Huiozyma naganishii CBS 8797]|uniref:Uncharacterized protein n=1 Tax=Huiozyma naganishii (strain ATCC MYA-139 / BCRC 22969 / CBS 8797 / KCTC 17520 / NBRC 10181 / NCYC 3082 / Yp74L-3) TaxID=1071383 RepID=J7S9D1_HUIN7|nr:hypothetical protein KNAG_0I02380 [Kazachstania naganishii CBS 8797]CCK72024.1 hypothetical protein KNAG_0I02380 [Kazachstania naganishii CBS 8797]